MTTYADFLASKQRRVGDCGHEIDPSEIHPMLHPFQRDIVEWAVRKGRAGIWTTTGTGKALDSDTLVVTPNGMVPIRDLRVGDFVTGADGKPTRVQGVFPQGERPSFRVTFSDDSSVVCDDGHLWTVRTRQMKYHGRGWRTLMLRDIRESGLGGSGESGDRWFIPMVEPAEFPEHDLPLHPYLLGCLIGDGHIKTATPSISSADLDLVEHLRQIVPLGVTVEKHRYSKYDYALVRDAHLQVRCGTHAANPVTKALGDLGLQGCGAESKRIPERYKFAAVDTRLLLLQGLMDTDGSVHTSNGSSVLEFSTVSHRLAKDFVTLIQSLGGKGRIRTKKTSGRLAYRVNPALPAHVNPFLLKRKADLFKARTKYMPARSIRSIEPAGNRDMTCISVEAIDGLFVVDGFIVTHNTIMQLEYARHSGNTGLITAPLAVCHQTVREATKLDLEVRYVRNGDQITDRGLWITNHEMVERFDPRELDVVVLDEGSILRDSTGKTRTKMIDHFAAVPRRASCTATPRPNDAEELTNQAEFLGICSRVDMLASYFIHDDRGWRPKGHARRPMFHWMSSWAMALRRPSDMGYPDEGYELPGLEIVPELLPVEIEAEGQLFATDLGGVGGRARVRRETLTARCERAAELVDSEPDEQWLLWCGLNDEAASLTRLIPGAVNVHGSLSPEEKAEQLLAFADGDIPVLVTKPSIASRGLNWQRCARMAFVGLGDSYEDYFQAIRRCYRYGQARVVRAHVVLSELESQIADNVARKEREADEFMAELVVAMQQARMEGVAA